MCEAGYRNFFEENKSVMLLTEPASGIVVDVNRAAITYFAHLYERLVEISVAEISTRLPERLLRRLEESTVRATECLSDSLSNGFGRGARGRG